VVYPFSNRIICAKCGHHYHRKHNNAGTKYEKIVWICSTFNIQGKAACSSQQIPENILCTKAAEALELPEFDETVFAEKISEIRVPSHNHLTFVFSVGHHVEIGWHNPSRRNSWTAEMKQVARERQNKIIEERRKRHEQ